MNFTTYQEEARKTAKSSNTYYLTLGLVGEAGEVANKVKKELRGDLKIDQYESFREDVKDELGDVLWYLSMLANQMGSSLEEIAVRNIEKLRDREQRGVLKGSGDKR